MGWLSFPWFAILTLLTKLSIFKGTPPKARHAAGLPQAGRQAPYPGNRIGPRTI